MGFLGTVWNGIKSVGSALWNGFTNGLGSIASSGINAYSQAEANASNERNVAATNAVNERINSATNAANMTMNRENIAMQQQENMIARQREDNAVQRRASDLGKAGLSKTLAAGSAASANSMQAGQNTMPMQSYEQKAFQKQAFKADLAGMNFQVNQNEALKAQTEYQKLVNDYLEEHGQLPPSGESSVLVTLVKELFPSLFNGIGEDSTPPTVDGKASSSPLVNTSNDVVGKAHDVLKIFTPSFVSDKAEDAQSVGRKVEINTNPMTATKDDIFKLCDAYRDGSISKDEYEKACDRLYSGTTNRAQIKKHFRDYWNRFK